MTDVFIDATLGGGSNNGTNWANAYNAGTQVDWTNAATDASAAGDRIIVASDQATVCTGNFGVTINANHTDIDPLQIIASASGSGTTVAPVTNFGTAGNGEIDGNATWDIEFAGPFIMYGMRIVNHDHSFIDGTGSPAVYEKCFYGMNKTTGNENYDFASGPTSVTMIDCTWEMSGGVHRVEVITDGVRWTMIGGKFTTDSAQVDIFRIFGGRSFICNFIGVDCSGVHANTDLFRMLSGKPDLVDAFFYGCKFGSTLPTLWSTTLDDLPLFSKIIISGPGHVVAAQYNNGNCLTETTILRDGGADTGSQAYSVKFESNAKAVRGQPMRHLFRVENPGDLDTLTVKCHFANNKGALTDAQIWIETSVTTSAGNITASDRNGLGATATTHTDESSNVDWRNGAGALTSYNEQSCDVTFSATTTGPIWVHLCIAADFSTDNLYVDPKLVIA